jgi:hypothetical protein
MRLREADYGAQSDSKQAPTALEKPCTAFQVETATLSLGPFKLD